MEKLLDWEAQEGLPLLVFTANTLIEAEPDRFQAQQYFSKDIWKSLGQDRKLETKFQKDQAKKVMKTVELEARTI